MIYQLVNNRPKIKLFLQKKFGALGALPSGPVPSLAGALPPDLQALADGDWPQTPNCLWQLGAPPPDPRNTPTLQISGDTPGNNIRLSSP